MDAKGSQNNSVIIICFWWIKKSKHREVKSSTQAHTAGK